ncbi:unnamed protein product [Brachionus calyciflorus]|uniref:Cns1/TTC4 wheel domain-containing protein n=1 Tax=Brachionus calyciflorus TaxID=104777 RepID=A0A813NBT5_9BILA|nr:unnamed protein product [Brachionus calyciflorus]
MSLEAALGETDDATLDLFLEKIRTEYKDGWTEENWEEEMEKHPLFMTKLPEDSDELPSCVEAIRQLKWDPDDTPKEKAVKLKDEGNLFFRAKKYSDSVVSYTMALKENIEDDHELMSTLHQNRAAAHYYLKNYRSSLSDCVFAKKFNQKNIKPIYKGAECCFELKNYDDCIKWCDWGLLINSEDNKLRELRSKAESNKKIYEREKRKKETLERKKNEKNSKIWNLIKKKGISVQEKEKSFLDLLENPVNPQQKVVDLTDDEQMLNWPVLFLYPEVGQTDFIESFNENSTFEDHLSLMFNQSPEWDQQKNYLTSTVQVYYENRNKGKLVKLRHKMTLLEALKQDGMIVQMGTPNFIVMVKNSSFEKLYIEKFNEIN